MVNQLFYGDNLEIMNKMHDECVDLIYLDPPFNSNRNYNFLYSQATGLPLPEEAVAFCDAWSLDGTKEESLRKLSEEMLHKGISSDFVSFWEHWVKALRNTNPKLLAYMVFMTERLVEMRRLLKSSGSIYLHCDPTASHYIKVIMDGIFGNENFRNEIIWKRTYSHNSAKRYGSIHDTIFFYTKNKDYFWNQTYQAYGKSYVDGFYKNKDEKGLYQLVDLTGAGITKGSSGQDWSGINPTKVGRHWAVPLKVLKTLIDEDIIKTLNTQQKLDILDRAELIEWPKKENGKPRYKKYLDDGAGVPLQDLFLDINPIHPHSKERLGYPTQKPLALLERIIKASCPENGVVFDPFCGCGTTVISAQQSNRNWIGIDICMLAVNSMEIRLQNLFPKMKKGKDYRVDGLPTTVEQAIQLANSSNTKKNEGRYQFQYWAIEKVNAFASSSKSNDGGIDGALHFYKNYQTQELGKMIISVKSDKNLKISYIRDLIGTLANSKAEMAGLICIDEPTEGMRQECLKAGFYDFEFMNQKQSFPKIQILTIKDIFDGKKFETPMAIQKKIAQHSKVKPKEIQEQQVCDLFD